MRVLPENILDSLNNLRKTLFFLGSSDNSIIYNSLILIGLLLIILAIIFKLFFSKNKNIPQKLIIAKKSLSSKGITKFIDLHLHLDGAITVDIAKKLASLQKIKLPTNDDKKLEALLTVKEDCRNLDDFLNCFGLPVSLLQTYEGIREAVKLVADNIQKQGVIYAEFRFAPQLFTKKGMSQQEVIEAALEGIKLASFKVNLILCFYRQDNNHAENLETLELAKKYLKKDGGVVALDIAGSEKLFPNPNFKDLFVKAKEYGIPFTMHAGEALGAESVRQAIEFGSSRIGHGVRAYEDPEVVQLLKDREIPLEVCPTSNFQTCALEDMDKYPFLDFLEKGLKVTLNTDDMGIEGTYLAKEFENMEKKYNLTYEQKKTILLNSVNAAFTTEEVKAKLKEELGC
jgi:adenosine deaminase